MIYTVRRPALQPRTRSITNEPIPTKITRKTLSGADASARRMLRAVNGFLPAGAEIEWFSPDVGVMSDAGVDVFVERAPA